MHLPAPSQDALAHQQKLLSFLESVYHKKGPLSFAEFMQIALYAPGLGYYSAGSQKFGKAGDFITAPLISPLFSQCLGAQCAEILTSLNHPQASILELGAGSGIMACDIILTLTQQKQLPYRYYILEVSAELRQRQQQLLKQHCPEYIDNIIWLDSLPKEPIIGIILGNEVIDAMPVHLFQISSNNEVLEGMVTLSEQQWQYHFDKPITDELADRVNALALSFEPGYTSEINLALPDWIGSLNNALEQGVMIFIDYGFPCHEYYHPDRHMGTLMCHYRHHAHHNPLLYIGLQDITAHVDFTAVALAGVHCGLRVAGFTNQAAFLIANDLTHFADNPQDTAQQIAYSQQIQQLTHPHEMGELFKVIALAKNYEEPLQGFQLIDQRHRL
ncbi:MAG: SAM-dependent methyltransferase [Gammaproteobacteria bacterium]|jgi:SAM-dependent MidA family methyltransferase|nr:SAM-dependent methyltransferase [Gammaproteobacteria bacterium]